MNLYDEEDILDYNNVIHVSVCVILSIFIAAIISVFVYASMSQYSMSQYSKLH